MYRGAKEMHGVHQIWWTPLASARLVVDAVQHLGSAYQTLYYFIYFITFYSFLLFYLLFYYFLF